MAVMLGVTARRLMMAGQGQTAEKGAKDMSEKEKDVIRNLADKLPKMTERERGYLEGTLATAAAMAKKGGTEAAGDAKAGVDNEIQR